MKKKNFLGYTGIIMAVVCISVLAGCSKDPPEPDSRLIGSWTNDHPAGTYTGNTLGYLKEFTINPNFSFEAKINVVFLTLRLAGRSPAEATAALGGTDYVWTISGNLQISEEGLYVMTVSETVGESYADPPLLPLLPPTMVQAFVGEGLQVVLSVLGNDHFKFSSSDGNVQVESFFGGDYYKVTT
jgi:hypothetical protein